MVATPVGLSQPWTLGRTGRDLKGGYRNPLRPTRRSRAGRPGGWLEVLGALTRFRAVSLLDGADTAIWLPAEILGVDQWNASRHRSGLARLGLPARSRTPS